MFLESGPKAPEARIQPADALKDKKEGVKSAVEQKTTQETGELRNTLAAEHERIKKDVELHMKSFLQNMKNVTEEKRTEFYKKAEEESTTVIELQMGHKWLDAKPDEKYAKLSSLFLEQASSNIKESFKISSALDRNPRIKMTIGAAHLLPPNVTEVRIIDTSNGARIGKREIRDGKVGYYDEKGYIPIFGGYQIDPLKIIDPNSPESRKLFEDEQRLAAQKATEYESAKKTEKADDLPSTLDAMTAATKEDLESKGYKADQIDMVMKGKAAYQKILQIFAYNNLRLDINSASQGARGFYSLNIEDFGWKEGITVAEMGTGNNKLITLLKTLQNGGKLEGKKIKGGYWLHFAHLPELMHLAKTEGKLKSILDGITQGEEIASSDIIKSIFDKGADGTSREAIMELVRKNPKMQHLIDPKWGIEAYKNLSWNKESSAIRDINYPTDADLNAGRDQEVVGSKCCAYTVSNYLNLKGQGYGNEYSAPRITMRLIRGGGKILSNISESQRGDVVVVKGTIDTVEKQQINHVLFTRDTCQMPNGDKLLVIQDNSRDLGIKFVACNPKDRKRLSRIVSEVKLRLRGLSADGIKEMIKGYGFNETATRIMTSAFIYRQKFPNTVRVAAATDSYFSSHLYAVIRPSYKKETIVTDDSTALGVARRARISDHA